MLGNAASLAVAMSLKEDFTQKEGGRGCAFKRFHCIEK